MPSYFFSFFLNDSISQSYYIDYFKQVSYFSSNGYSCLSSW
jgi:hypothetical protein